MRWQLDTGADVNMSYGDVADRAGLSREDSTSFPVRKLQIGTTIISDTLTFIRREMSSDGDVTGTLGLNSLMGRIAIIDYPAQRFCLFDEANLPAPFWSTSYTKAILRDRKFFIPVQVGGFRSDAVLFDTGSSEVPLNIDAPLWVSATGRLSVEQSDKRISGQAWGKKITLFGALASDELHMGEISLGKQIIYTEQTDDTFAKSDYKIDGIMGNAAVWDGVVVLDLTVRTRFGLIKP